MNQRYYGKHRGVVTAVADDRNQGRIEVQVPSILGTEAKVWARACMPYGHFYVPPVGAQVWVEFEAGDIELPLWVGTWYPEGAAPAEGRPDHRVIQTVAGHTIELVDTEGAEKILIRHASDAFVSIDEHGSILISNPKGSHVYLDAEHEKATLVEQHGNHLTMGENGTSIVNPDGTLVDITGDTVNVAAKNVVLQSQSVALGAGASEPTVMGTGFGILWQALTAAFATHTHATTLPGAPTGPALPTFPPVPLAPGVHLTTEVLVK